MRSQSVHTMTANPTQIHPEVTGKAGGLTLSIKDKAGLHVAYMPFLRHGGIFVPSPRPYRLGEEVQLWLSLLDQPQKYAITGKVVWVTPVGTANKTPGVGVAFPDDEMGRTLKKRIEELLGGLLTATRPTQTL